jgi:hypothetical protein
MSLLKRSSTLASTVRALRGAAAHRPTLSTDAVHGQRLDQLRSAVTQASDIIQAT